MLRGERDGVVRSVVHLTLYCVRASNYCGQYTPWINRTVERVERQRYLLQCGAIGDIYCVRVRKY